MLLRACAPRFSPKKSYRESVRRRRNHVEMGLALAPTVPQLWVAPLRYRADQASCYPLARSFCRGRSNGHFGRRSGIGARVR
jgi:hypothetical protein